jgi:enoyl-CoA hydratase/carnithine racemase
MTLDTVEYERIDGVAWVRLRRPESHNALNPEMVARVVTLIDEASADDAVGAIVLAGGEQAFTTGLDLKRAHGLSADEFREQIDGFQRLASALYLSAKPTIAAVSGYAYGGGLEIALNCDARIATPSARFACPEVGWGLTLTNGSSIHLRNVVGEGWARELLLFGTVVDAELAQRIGLVTRLVADERLELAATEMAQRAASGSPRAQRLTKRLLADPRWDKVLEQEADAVIEGFTSGDVVRRLEEFVSRAGAGSGS